MNIRSFVIFLLIGCIRASVRCPYFCSCDIWNGLKRVVCTHKNLANSNVGAPSVMQAFDISINSISELQNEAFHRSIHLKYLNISFNKITDIHRSAFYGLTGLNILDLSHNHLKYISPQIFDATPMLQDLYLTGNEIGNFGRPPVLQIPSLQTLFMKECWLDSMNEDSFSGLPNLSRLDISGNQFTLLRVGFIHSLNKLNYLNLTGNPWVCDITAQEVIEQLMEKNVDVSPVCENTSKSSRGQDMFEKISNISKSSEEYENIETLQENLPAIWLENEYPSDPTKTHESIVQNVIQQENHKNVENFMGQIPAFWAFMLGLQIGTVVAVLGMWTWLQCKCSQNPAQIPLRPRTQTLSESVRRSVGRLRTEDTNNYTELQSIDCPGTPPPPYRDVLLSCR